MMGECRIERVNISRWWIRIVQVLKIKIKYLLLSKNHVEQICWSQCSFGPGFATQRLNYTRTSCLDNTQQATYKSTTGIRRSWRHAGDSQQFRPSSWDFDSLIRTSLPPAKSQRDSPVSNKEYLMTMTVKTVVNILLKPKGICSLHRCYRYYIHIVYVVTASVRRGL